MPPHLSTMIARRALQSIGRIAPRPSSYLQSLQLCVDSKNCTGSGSQSAASVVDRSMDTILATAGCEDFDNHTGVLSAGVDSWGLIENDARLGQVRIRRQLECTLQQIEEGSSAFVFAQLDDLLLDFLSCFPRSHLLIPDYLYRGVTTVLPAAMTRWGLTFERVDFTNHSHVKERLEALKQEHPERHVVVWLESVTAGKVKVMEIPKLSAMVKAVIGEEKSFVMVDSTFATPFLMKPLTLGADATLHRTTRYLGGHHDNRGAALVLGDSKPSHSIAGFMEIAFQSGGGKGLESFPAWLVLRGLSTLSVRMHAHSVNALALAEYLQGHKAVKKVYYPGLVSYSRREMANELLQGRFGGTVAFTLKEDESRHVEAALKVMEHTKMFRSNGLSGGTISSIMHCASMPNVPAIMPKNLLRVAVGLEDIGDLLSDLDAALSVVLSAR